MVEKEASVGLGEVQSQGEETKASDQQNEPQLGLKDQQVLDVKSYAHLFSKSTETASVHLAEKEMGLSSYGARMTHLQCFLSPLLQTSGCIFSV